MMNPLQQDVILFMRSAGQDCPALPTAIDEPTRKLRVRLIAGELAELCQTCKLDFVMFSERNLCPPVILQNFLNMGYVECSGQENEPLMLFRPIRGLGRNIDIRSYWDDIFDLLYVVIGSAVACGTDIDHIWKEGQYSNMSKFIDGHRDPGGKWIKGPSFVKPDWDKVFLEVTSEDSKWKYVQAVFNADMKILRGGKTSQ